MELKNRFEKVFLKYTTDKTVIEELWEGLHKHYSESFRAYHNLTHLNELFSYLDMYSSEIEDLTEFILAIFYHDIIYNVWKKDNEEKSADFAVKVLNKLKLQNVNTANITAHILATKTHTSNSNDTSFLIDFDLAILGQSWEVYLDYTKKIRTEYKTVPNIIYYKGRKKVLEHFLNKKSIFTTAIFKNKYEDIARTNLKSEIELINKR